MAIRYIKANGHWRSQARVDSVPGRRSAAPSQPSLRQWFPTHRGPGFPSAFRLTRPGNQR